MRRRLGENKTRMLVDKAVAKTRQGQRVETAAAMGGGGGFGGGGNAGVQPIQDPDGVLYDMCGVSECGGPDITGP